MELWIRSQDKKHLIKCDGLYINKSDNGIKKTYKIMIDFIDLGIYKTEERAIEVLNEIQNMIKPILINTEYHSEIKQGINNLSFDVIMQPVEDKITYIQSNVVIYEMPEE